MSNILQQINYKRLFLSVRGKVIVAFLTACVAVLLAWVVMHTVFRETLRTVDKLAVPNERQMLINRIFKSISKINQLQYVQYSEISNMQAPDKFITATERLKIRLDSLSMYDPHNATQQQRIDSMKYLINQHQKVYLGYVKLKDDIIRNHGFSKRIKRLSDLVTESSSKIDTNVVTSRQKITTVIEPEEQKQVRGEKSQLASFIDKIFGKKKPREDVKLKKTVTEEYNIKVDTLSLSQQDSMLRMIEQYMGKMTTDQQRKSYRFIEREKDLMKSSNIIVNRLFSLISSIKDEEAQLTATESEQAATTISGGLFRLNIIIVLFFTTVGLLSLLILFDIAKSNRYRKALQEAKEEAERLTQVKQRFLANMSHEIRTPLQSILGFAEQAHKQQTADTTSIDAIYKSSSHLLHIVNEVLDYSRITSGKFTINNQPFNMSRLVSEVAGTLEVHTKARALQFIVTHSLDPDKLYVGDAFRLKQLLYNLLGNAVKFTRHGSVELTIEEEKKDSTAMLRFTISDTGIGMSEQQLRVVFNEFEQANEHIAKEYGGTGLGLSIVKELVTVMGGKIGVESRPGSGTVFTLELSYGTTDLRTQESPVEALALNIDLKREVWMADDDAYIRKVCSVIFDTYGISYRLFASAEELLDAYQASSPLYLLDIRMPGINGFELCRMIRQRNADAVIIALTAQALPEEHATIIENGFDTILTKPFTEQELLQAICRFTKNQHKEESQTFDLAGMKRYAQGNDAVLKQNLQLFIAECRKDLAELKISIAGNNGKQIYELLHKLAGRVGLAGAKSLTAKLRELERKVSSGSGWEKQEIISACDHIEQLILQLSVIA